MGNQGSPRPRGQEKCLVGSDDINSLRTTRRKKHKGRAPKDKMCTGKAAQSADNQVLKGGQSSQGTTKKTKTTPAGGNKKGGRTVG